MLAEHRAFADNMTKAGQLAADTLRYIASFVKEGTTTLELDDLMDDYILSRGGRSACRGYYGYPAATCISINHIAAHGVPSEYKLKADDFLNIDVTVNLNGYFGDTSRMFFVNPTLCPQGHMILAATEKAQQAGIEQCLPYNTSGDISFAIGKSIIRSGYNTTKLVGGHGIGTFFHGEPWISFHGKKNRGTILQPYTCITIEPILMSTSDELIEEDIPGSTIKVYKAKEGVMTAQLEHTVLITDTGYEVLTL